MRSGVENVIPRIRERTRCGKDAVYSHAVARPLLVACIASVTSRSYGTERIRTKIDDLFAEERELPEILEEVARLGRPTPDASSA